VCSYTCEGPIHAAPFQLDVFLLFDFYVKLFDLYYSVYPGPSETVRGSNFYCSCCFIITLVYPLSLCDKKGE
jgi:hypothetical protein